MNPFEAPSAHFIRINQYPLRSFIEKGGLRSLKAVGIRYLFGIWSKTNFENCFFDRKCLTEISHRNKAASALQSLALENFIEIDKKVIRVSRSFAKKNLKEKDGTPTKSHKWFRLHDDAFALAKDKNLNFTDLSVLITIYAYVEYKNEYKLSITETGKKIGVRQGKCSLSFKKLIELGYITTDYGHTSKKPAYLANNNIITKGRIKCQSTKQSS